MSATSSRLPQAGRWRTPGVAAGLLALSLATLGFASLARASEPVALSVFAAGTLAVPFRALDAAFQQKHPEIAVRPQFAGSVKLAKQITELHQPADILAVADYSVIPKYLFGGAGKPAEATWYAGFARNAVTFVYTQKSKFAAEVSSENWYQVLARPGVEIGRSNPDTDPSGYQTVQMLDLAGRHYGVPDLAAKILANAPPRNMRDTETALLAALELGEIDYLAIYRSDALQHHLAYLMLPPQIDLSDPAQSAFYAGGVAHTANGNLAGKPIVYAITIPADAAHKDWAERYAAFVLGPEGQAIMAENGFGSIAPAYAVGIDKLPAGVVPLVARWPGS